MASWYEIAVKGGCQKHANDENQLSSLHTLWKGLEGQTIVEHTHAECPSWFRCQQFNKKKVRCDWNLGRRRWKREIFWAPTDQKFRLCNISPTIRWRHNCAEKFEQNNAQCYQNWTRKEGLYTFKTFDWQTYCGQVKYGPDQWTWNLRC